MRRLLLVALVATVVGVPLAAQSPALEIPPGAQASPAFDATRATDAYLATVPPDKKARSDAYFEGGYWLLLWNFLYGVAGSGRSCHSAGLPPCAIARSG